jgi:single-strand DNA-binding protein
MGNGLNRVILIGNIGGEPDLHEAGESAVLEFSVATSERFKKKDGNYGEQTEWHTIKLWGNRARALSNILVRGMKVCVEGSIRIEKWEKDGQKRSKGTIVARDVILLEPKKSNSSDGWDD